MSQSHLPDRFPIGTKLIVEAGRSGRSRIYRRRLEFPDGRVLRLPDQAATILPGKAPQERRRSRPD